MPAGAKFWGCYVDGQSSKAETDQGWLLVPLPQRANRDEAFAVDIVYAQGIGDVQGQWFPRRVTLEAPKTDLPNTFAEWQLYRPDDSHFSSFGGSMTVARGTTYGLHDAWGSFCDFYSTALEPTCRHRALVNLGLLGDHPGGYGGQDLMVFAG